MVGGEKYLGWFKVVFKQRWKYLLALLIIFTVFTLYFFQFSAIPKKIILLTGVLSGLGILLIGKNLAKSTFWIILLMGTLFTFITPVLDTPDEHAHFSRAVYLSEGHFGMSDKADELKISKDFKVVLDRVHHNYYNDLKQQRHTKKQNEEPIISLTATYSFISYVPQAIGWSIGKLLNLNLYWSFYLGRLVNLIAYAILSYFAIKNVKKFKVPMAVVTTLPMVVYLAASYNQDGVSYGLVFLALSLFINFITNEAKIEAKEIGVFLLLCGILATCKLPYVMLAGILIFIKPSQYKNRKTYLFAWGAVILAAIIALLWYYYYTTFTPANRVSEKDPTEQLKFMVHNVPTAIKLMFSGIVDSISKYHELFTFGWFSYGSPHIWFMYLVYMGGLFVFYPLEIKAKYYLNTLGSAVVMLGIIFAINLSQYLTWTPVGLGTVEGVQGRYYIGLLVLLPIFVNSSKLFYPQTELSEQRELMKKLEYAQNIWVLSIATYFLMTMILLTLGNYYRG
ncbi:hypothetical protein ATZ33_17960 [Enterococcus silesiacus]|uniref:DUF2142 domain-containing protein n=1 Tax=Enterococcus silesiacus TaxID=332949 RepID=A0ABM5WD83_9ENTE|nr:DUF2142 domain-containing protein [Enterococcus silesiacus]ALS03190.1 hypothetical protein ATZ33_17960 [Enterococcus silesiacus]